MRSRNAELIILMTAVIIVSLAPLFILAAKVDGDEYTKGSLGIIGGGAVAVFTIYRMWRGDQ